MKSLAFNSTKLFGALSALFILVSLWCIYVESFLPSMVLIALAFMSNFVSQPIKLFWVLLLSIPLSIEYTFDSGISTDFPDEFLMILVTACSFLVLGLSKSVALPYALRHPLLLIVVLQLVWALANITFSTYPILSLKYFLAKIWYVLPFILFLQGTLQSKRDFRSLAIIVVIPILFVALYSMYYHYDNDFSFLTINDSLQPFFRNHVNYAAMLTFALSICFVSLRHSPNPSYKIIISLAIIVLLIALFFSYTRGSWLSLVVSSIALLLFYKQRLLQSLKVILVVVFGLFVWMSFNDNYSMFKPTYEKTIFQSSLTQHLNSMYSMQEISGAERIHRWIAGVRMIAERPLTGFGSATFYKNYKPYCDPRFKTWVSANPEKSSVHNYFLLVWIEQGLIGFVLFIFLILYFFSRSQRLYAQLHDPFYKTVLAGIVLIMVNILVVNFFSDMIETDKVGSFFFICIGLLIWLDASTKAKQIA